MITLILFFMLIPVIVYVVAALMVAVSPAARESYHIGLAEYARKQAEYEAERAK